MRTVQYPSKPDPGGALRSSYSYGPAHFADASIERYVQAGAGALYKPAGDVKLRHNGGNNFSLRRRPREVGRRGQRPICRNRHGHRSGWLLRRRRRLAGDLTEPLQKTVVVTSGQTTTLPFSLLPHQAQSQS